MSAGNILFDIQEVYILFSLAIADVLFSGFVYLHASKLSVILLQLTRPGKLGNQRVKSYT